MVNAPLSAEGLQDSITPWFESEVIFVAPGPIGLVWWGPIARCGVAGGIHRVRIGWPSMLHLAAWLRCFRVGPDRLQTIHRSLRTGHASSRCGGHGPVPLHPSFYALGMQAFRAEDIDRAIRCFGRLRSGSDWREPDINALPPIPSQWDGVTRLLHACAVVAAPESDLVPPALLLP